MEKRGLYRGKIKKDKKGISNLVATVLLILIVVALIVVIWAIIMPMISKSAELGEACADVQLLIDKSSGYTCYSEKYISSSTMISRLVGQVRNYDLVGILLSIRSEAESKSHIIRANENLILYTEFEECSGTDITDLSGNSNHGQILGNAIWKEEKYRCALDTSSGYGSFPDIDMDEFTIEIHVKPA